MPPPFEIRIVSHGWLDGADPNHDLCSHGTLELIVSGTPVVTAKDCEFCLSAAALHLLRTKSRDHKGDSLVTLDKDTRLVPDDGHAMLPDETGGVVIFSCPIGVDWQVHHVDGAVVLDDFRFYPTTNTDDVRHIDVRAVVSEDDWRCAVDRFAREVADLFTQVNKRVEDEFYAEGFRRFWAEFRDLVGDQGVGPITMP